MNVVNRQWQLARRPVGLAKVTDFAWHEAPIPAPGPGQALIRNQFLSLDPTNRSWMREEDTYLPAQRIGEVMRGMTIGIVARSYHPTFPVGTMVAGALGWQDYAVSDGQSDFLTPLPDDSAIPPTMHLGLFGHIGVTAYFGLLDIGKPQPGETLVVSAAAGAVGSLAGQIGKIHGCKVIGIAGSDEKCQWLRDELRFDATINYKTQSVHKHLKEHCRNGIDIYFDNVGGAILEDVLGLVNLKARIAVCGMISSYNEVGSTLNAPPGPNNLLNLVIKRARMEGFLCSDYWHRSNEAIAALAGWHKEGKLTYRVDVVEGLQNAPQALNKLFDGGNVGKLIIKI
jgi:NADPH-dependent curcumin reductase